MTYQCHRKLQARLVQDYQLLPISRTCKNGSMDRAPVSCNMLSSFHAFFPYFKSRTEYVLLVGDEAMETSIRSEMCNSLVIPSFPIGRTKHCNQSILISLNKYAASKVTVFGIAGSFFVPSFNPQWRPVWIVLHHLWSKSIRSDPTMNALVTKVCSDYDQR